MVLYEVFSHAELKRYKASIFSKASLVQLVSVVLTFLSPFLITYFMGGFWIREKVGTEQPQINFQYRFIALLQGDTSMYLASSFQNVNQIYASIFCPSTRSITEFPIKDSFYNQKLEFQMYISNVPVTEIIRNVKLLLLFNVSLSTNAAVTFESIAYLESSSSTRTSEINFGGVLEFFQTDLLRSSVVSTDYAYQLLNNSNLDLQQLNVASIVGEYSSRPYGTKLSTDYVSWSNQQADGFTISGRVRYPLFRVSYIPWFWEQFKWGWIQYISVLLPFLFIFKLIKIFLFENQIVATIAISAAQKHKSC